MRNVSLWTINQVREGAEIGTVHQIVTKTGAKLGKISKLQKIEIRAI
jgi:hypothetical protein